MHEVCVVTELGSAFVQLTLALNEHSVGTYHQNVGDFLIVKERFKWSEAKDVIKHALHQLCAEIVGNYVPGLLNEFLNPSTALSDELFTTELGCSTEVKCRQ